MSREVCGICWCPYDEETGGCACATEPNALLPRKPLTDEEIVRLMVGEDRVQLLYAKPGDPYFSEFAEGAIRELVDSGRAVERAHGIGDKMNDDINKFSIGVPSEQIEPNIVFRAASNEVMRIDKRGITVNPAYSVDEATQRVLDALSGHIQHMVAQAVAAEREACAVAGAAAAMAGHDYESVAAAIRARGKE